MSTSPLNWFTDADTPDRIVDADDALVAIVPRSEDRERIVDCVNACAGTEDPATDIPQALRALQDGADFLAEFYEEGREHVVIQRMDVAIRALSPSALRAPEA